MPRQNRNTLLPGYPLHVLQRGHNKSRCFPTEAEHSLYLGLLQEYSKRHRCPVHAYVLMSNHVHLLVSPPDIPSISRLMHDVNQVFAQRFNRKYLRCGSVWQGRFNASLVDSAGYFMTCQRYIECNPLRAGMVPAPGSYPWSSYGTNADGRPSLLVTPHRLYHALADSDEARRAAYRSLFGTPMLEEEVSQVRTAIQRNRPLGNEDFVREVEATQALLREPVPNLSQVPGPYQAPVLPEAPVLPVLA
jgi:putative transposase